MSGNQSFNSDNVSPGSRKFGSQFNLAGKELHSSSSETSSEGYVSDEVNKILLVENEETKERAKTLSDLQDSELNEEQKGRKYLETEPNKSIDQSEEESESRV